MRAPLVRSDVEIDFLVMDSQGALHVTGTFDAGETVSRLRPRDRRDQIKVPHMHRASPSGDWLASYDPATRRLTLRSVAAPSRQRFANASPQIAVDAPADAVVVRSRVGKLSGAIRTFRWLDDDSGIVFHTSRGLYLVRPDTAGIHRRVTARAILKAGDFSRLDGEVKDFRMIPGGLIARTEEHLYHVSLDGRRAAVRDLTPPGFVVQEAVALSRGRVAMLVADRDTYSDELLIMGPTGSDTTRLKVIASRSCVDCGVTNWAPGAERITFATHRGAIYRESGAESPEAPGLVALEADSDVNGELSLWSNARDDRVVATGSHRVQMWDGDGNPLWTWNPREYRRVISAHFEADGETVLVTTDWSIVRVKDGETVAEVFGKKDLDALRRSPRDGAFLEGAIPLADGSIAFSVIHERGQRDRKRRQKARRDKKRRAANGNRARAAQAGFATLD